MMKNIIIILLIGFVMFATAVLAANIDFRIEAEDKTYFPNETIPINISVLNRDISIIRDVNISMIIGKRQFNYNIGNIKSDNSIIRNLTLPEFPPGNYIIKGMLNYTDFFDKTETLTIYNSFHVRFPEMQRLPRNIIIKEFSIPDNITAGKTYTVSIKVSNDGSVAGDLIVGLSSMDVDTSKQIHLEPGQAENVNIDVKFYNAGISVAEAKIYALVDSVKYLLTYDTKNIFVKEAKVAKIEFDKVELVDEPDNEINQNDAVKLKIYLKNTGNDMASDVNAILSSHISNIEIKHSEDYKLILAKESTGKIFEIETKNADVGSYNMSLVISFVDSFGTHTYVFLIPIEMKADMIPPCSKDIDCSSDEVCRNQNCENLVCNCGNAVNHQCQKYACCSDFDCEEGYVCSSEKHICEPSKEIKVDVLIVTSTNLKTNDDYTQALLKYRKTILEEGLTSFYITVDSQKVQDLFNIQPANPADWKSVKNVLDKIIYKVEPEYLLILGGVDIIPQPPAKTDAEIPTIPPSDDRYVDTDIDGIPDIAVGRIPTVPRKNEPDIVINSLKTAVKIHKTPYITSKFIIANPCGTAGSCNRYIDNNYISEIIFDKSCEINEMCKVPPPYCLGGLLSKCSKKSMFKNILINSNLLYFGCHGSGISFASNDDDGWHQILSGNELYDYKLNNTFVMTTACHGGTIDCEEVGCLGTEGTGFAFLANGAGVYIANTRYGYRYITPHLYGHILEKMKIGETVGSALLKMKQEKLRNCWTDGCKAIIYEIQLYGDPTIKLIGV